MNFDIARFMTEIGYAILPFLFAITVHEVSHGYAAYLLGDNTAKNAGRLTLNPIKHLDVVGLLVLLLTRMIGWAKPVPVDFRIVSRKKYGPLFVAAAGPVSNFITALLSALLLKMMIFVVPSFADNVQIFIERVLILSIQINVVLGIFNLLPLLPMDGGRILQNLLPPKQAYQYSKIEPYGMIILLVLVFTGVIREFMGPVFTFVTRIFYSIALGGAA